MSNRIGKLLRKYQERSEERADQNLWEFAAEEDPHLFSHHPARPEFRSHLWKFRGLYFCKGCVMTFAGAIFGLILFFLFGWLRWFSDLEIGMIFGALLLPAVLGAVLELPRPIRHVGRFLLGVLIASAFLMLFVTDSWLVRLAIVGVYLGAKIPLERLRERQNEEKAE